MLDGMKRWIAAALLAGCYRSSPAPPPEPARPAYQEPQRSSARSSASWSAAPRRSMIGQVIMKLGQFADDMCACKDRTCADAVQDALSKWTSEMSHDREDLEKPTEEEMEEARQISQRLASCMVTAMGHGTPVTPTPPTP
jgi:hypothetical protein